MILETAALAAISGVPALAATYAGYFSWRGRRRNERDLCADCAGPHYAAPAYEAPALVQGRTVCGPCAARHRRRMSVALSAAGVLSGAAVVAMGVGAAAGTIGWAAPAVVGAEYVAVFGGAVAWMKRRNRKARLEIAALKDACPRLPGPAGAALTAR